MSITPQCLLLQEHLEHVLCLVEEIALTAGDAFGGYVPTVLPLLLSSLVCPRLATQSSKQVSGAG